jgi:hypothetical protein
MTLTGKSLSRLELLRFKMRFSSLEESSRKKHDSIITEQGIILLKLEDFFLVIRLGYKMT